MHLHISLLVFQKTPHTAQWKVTLLTFICCLFTPSGWCFFLFHYTQSKYFCIKLHNLLHKKNAHRR